ncbi:MAG: hypothetical protein ACRDDL_08375 [Sarcina sp.]
MNSFNKTKSITKLINKVLWLVTLISYIIISFTTHAWHITWVMFFLPQIITLIAEIIFIIKEN